MRLAIFYFNKVDQLFSKQPEEGLPQLQEDGLYHFNILINEATHEPLNFNQTQRLAWALQIILSPSRHQAENDRNKAFAGWINIQDEQFIKEDLENLQIDGNINEAKSLAESYGFKIFPSKITVGEIRLKPDQFQIEALFGCTTGEKNKTILVNMATDTRTLDNFVTTVHDALIGTKYKSFKMPVTSFCSNEKGELVDKETSIAVVSQHENSIATEMSDTTQKLRKRNPGAYSTSTSTPASTPSSAPTFQQKASNTAPNTSKVTVSTLSMSQPQARQARDLSETMTSSQIAALMTQQKGGLLRLLQDSTKENRTLSEELKTIALKK